MREPRVIDHDPTLLISLLLTRNLAETILRQPYDDDYNLIGSRGDYYEYLLVYVLLIKNKHDTLLFMFSKILNQTSNYLYKKKFH